MFISITLLALLYSYVAIIYIVMLFL